MELETSRWGPLEVLERIAEGHRNEVWRGRIAGTAVSIRRSRRNAASLDWDLDLITDLAQAGFSVPAVIETIDGRRHLDGVVVQRWLYGHAPASANEWHLVARTLQQLHLATAGYQQRPGCVAVAELTRTSVSVDADMSRLPDDVADDLLAVFATVAAMPVSVIHGDPVADNVRIDDYGRVGLLDFDESRVDVAWHDLSNLGVQVLDDDSHQQANKLSDAWEAANGWLAEPAYARRRLAALRESLSAG